MFSFSYLHIHSELLHNLMFILSFYFVFVVCSGSKIFSTFIAFLISKDSSDGTELALLNELKSFDGYIKENVSLLCSWITLLVLKEEWDGIITLLVLKEECDGIITLLVLEEEYEAIYILYFCLFAWLVHCLSCSSRIVCIFIQQGCSSSNDISIRFLFYILHH